MTTKSEPEIMILDGIIIWDPYRFMKIDHLRSQKHFQNFMSYRLLKVLDLKSRFEYGSGYGQHTKVELFNLFTNVWDSSNDWTYNINSERLVIFDIIWETKVQTISALL